MLLYPVGDCPGKHLLEQLLCLLSLLSLDAGEFTSHDLFPSLSLLWGYWKLEKDGRVMVCFLSPSVIREAGWAVISEL